MLPRCSDGGSCTSLRRRSTGMLSLNSSRSTLWYEKKGEPSSPRCHRADSISCRSATVCESTRSSTRSDDVGHSHDNAAYWPLPSDNLHRTTLMVLSVHNLPKVQPLHLAFATCASCSHPQQRSPHILLFVLPSQRGEQRPRFNGSRGACHRYHPELSGSAVPTSLLSSKSRPSLQLTLHPVGGTPLPHNPVPLGLSVACGLLHMKTAPTFGTQ